MHYLRALIGVAALTGFVVACSSEAAAPLGGGGTGSVTGGGGGGSGGGSGDGGSLTQSVLGWVTFTDHATQADAGSNAASSSVSAQFLEGADHDGGDALGAVQLPAGCTQASTSTGDTTCRRIDCDQNVTTDPAGTPRSAGRLSLSGVNGVEGIDPSDAGTYPLLSSVGAPYWLPGTSLAVNAAGDAVPGFRASLIAVAALNLSLPGVAGDGSYALSRSVGFAFSTTQTVEILRLSLTFQVALDGGSRRLMYDCVAPGTSGQLTLPSELVADLPEGATPVDGSFFGEVSTSVELGSSAAPLGRVLVSARRAVLAADASQLVWSRFVVIP